MVSSIHSIHLGGHQPERSAQGYHPESQPSGQVTRVRTMSRALSDFLHVVGPVNDPVITRSIMEHPTLTRLKLRDFTSNPRSALWDKLLGFHGLWELAISNKEAFGANIEKFWSLCTRLERLEINSRQHSTPRNIPSMEFPRIRDLRVYESGIDSVHFFFSWSPCRAVLVLHPLVGSPIKPAIHHSSHSCWQRGRGPTSGA